MSTDEQTIISHTSQFPVVEIFGPTIQGEGTEQGIPCYFIRFGGCDYKCEWCDSPHAVLAEAVRRADRLTAEAIIGRIRSLSGGPKWVILSGGNPAMHDLRELVNMLRHNGYKVAVETQGTKNPSWIRLCDRVCVSPKPPSAGPFFKPEVFESFMYQRSPHKTFLKVVVGDRGDYEFARDIHHKFPGYTMYLSALNDAGATVNAPDRIDGRSYQQVVFDLVQQGRWLANQLMVDPAMDDVRLQVQNHVLYWGNEHGR